MTWTRLCADASCVEYRTDPDDPTTVWVRDSDAPHNNLPVLTLSWEAFLAAVRAPVEAERDDARLVALRLANQAPMILGAETKIVTEWSPESLEQQRRLFETHQRMLIDAEARGRAQALADVQPVLDAARAVADNGTVKAFTQLFATFAWVRESTEPDKHITVPIESWEAFLAKVRADALNEAADEIMALATSEDAPPSHAMAYGHAAYLLRRRTGTEVAG